MGWRIDAALNQKPIGCLYSLAQKKPNRDQDHKLQAIKLELKIND